MQLIEYQSRWILVANPQELNAILREKIRVMEAEKKAAANVPYPYAADKS